MNNTCTLFNLSVTPQLKFQIFSTHCQLHKNIDGYIFQKKPCKGEHGALFVVLRRSFRLLCGDLCIVATVRIADRVLKYGPSETYR